MSGKQMWSQGDEQEFQQNLKALGPVKKDRGTIEFNYFVKVYELCDHKAKNMFQGRKMQLIS